MSAAEGAPQPAWASFWSGEDGSPVGCLPDRALGIDGPRRAAWRQFARGLGKAARVLDLASGNGQVMADLLAVRRDLKPVGIDLAPKLPPPPAGAKLRAKTAMEALPFPAATYAAVTSQFGFEYGEIAVILSEVARVLVPRGQVMFMVHNGNGPILAHNRRRRAGLRWVLDEKLPARARAGLRLRATGLVVPPGITAAAAQAERLFGLGSAGWELSTAVVQTLTLGVRDNPVSVAKVLDKLEHRACEEVARIDALEAACVAVADPSWLTAKFSEAGLVPQSPELLIDRDSALPFATVWRARSADS